MVARGAGAAGPVLLACRQWDPLGLARWLPSLGAGAWRRAPLLPWRAQCPVCVRAALAAGSGGFGPAPGVVSLSFPPPRPACCALRGAGRPVRVSLTLARWYAIPCGLCVPRARSGCPSGSPRVSPFVCVRSRSRGVRSPPRWVVCRGHLAWSRHWALVGPFRVVRAPPRVLPRSLAPSGVLGGGRSGPGSPLLGLGLWGRRQGVPGGVPSTVAWGVWGLALFLSRLPVHWVGCRGLRCGRGRAGVGALLCPCGGCAPRGGSMAFLCWGAGWGGGACAVSSGSAAGAGPVGRGVALPLPVPLPSLGRQQSGRHWRCAVHGGRGPPYHSGSYSPGFSGYDLCGVPVRRRGPARSSRPPCEPAAGAGGRSHSGSPLGRGGPIPPASGGGGRGARGWRAGGGVGGGAVAPRPPCSRSGRRPAVLLSGPLRVAGALPSGARVRLGLKCRPGVGGGEGRPVDRSPGGPS